MSGCRFRNAAARACTSGVATICLLLLWPALSGCQAVRDAADRLRANVQKPRVSLQGARFGRLDLEGARLLLDVRVENPYGVSVPFTNLAYTMRSGGAAVVSAQVDHPGTLPANGVRDLEVPVEVTFSSLLGVLGSVRPGAVVPYEVEVDVGVDLPGAGAVELPLRHEGSLPVPAMPEVSLRDLRVETQGLTELKLTLETEVLNPNSFPLDLEALDLGLELAGHRIADLSAEAGGSLDPGASTSISLPVRLGLASGGRALLSILQGGAVDYRLTGRLAAETPFGPLELPIAGDGRAPVER